MPKKLSESNATRRRWLITLFDNSQQPLPNITITPSTDILITKGDGTQVAGGGTWTECTGANLGHGVYTYQALAAEMDTLGQIKIRVTKAGINLYLGYVEIEDEIQAVDQNDAVAGGMSNLDTTVSSRAAPGAAMNLAASAIGSGTFAAGAITTAAFAAGAISVTVAPNLDAAVSSRAAPGAAMTLQNGSIVHATFGAGAIDSTVAPNLDAAVSSRAAPGAAMTLTTGAIVSSSFAAGAITANAITDGSITAAKFAASAITSTVAPNLDAAVSSRMAAGAQVTPADGSITAAKFGAGAINSTVAPNLDTNVGSRAAPGDQMNLAASAITSAKFGAGAITSTVVADGFLTGAKIGAGAIGSTQAPNLDVAVSTRAAPGAAMNLASAAISASTFAANAIASGALDATALAAIGASSLQTALSAPNAPSGSLGDAVAVTMALVTGNYALDTVTYSGTQISGGRIRLWRSASAMGTPTSGAGLGTQGEFAAFQVTGTVSGSQVTFWTVKRIL